MFIEEVIIDGFKSYATRTVLSGFDPHFNAITGLNGSGKSNILDSICFVLGISNLSQVRVGNLQELVYKQGQAGVTKASVTLVFNNNDKKGSPVGYESFDQITIARQVVIGGKNKYLINGATAQASQVQNLFHSVQLNVNNPHFLIMQGRITKVLNMKPPEILGMIEEAAGTRMFETKKQSALKTMDKKQTKVDEINSILSDEITPTLEKLRGEKSHYLQWSANNTEMERLERFCVAHGFKAAEATVSQSAQELGALQDEADALSDQVDSLRTLAEEKEAEAEEVAGKREEQASGEYKKASKTEEALSKELVKSTSEWTNRKTALKTDLKALEALKESEAEGGAAEAAKEKELAACQAAVDAASSTATAAAAAHSALQLEYQNMCAGVASADNAESLTLTDQIAAAAADAAGADAAAGQAALRSKHLAAGAKTAEKELKAAEKEVGKLRKDHTAAASAAAAAAAAVAALAYDEAAAARLAEQKDADESALSEAQHSIEALTAQLAGRLFFEYSSPHAGFDRSRVKGLVAKLVTVPDAAHTTALEVAAGGKLYQVVVDDEQTGKALLQKGGLRRRVTIIPQNKIAHKVLDRNQLDRAAVLAERLHGTATLAVELVGFEEEVRAAMEYVFGTTIVCNSLETAKAVAFDKGVKARTVTLEGDSFEPQGTLTGGSTAQLGVVLAKLRDLQAVTLQAGALQQRLQQVNAQLAAAAAAGKQHAALTQKLALAQEQADILGAQLGASSAAQLVTRLSELTAGIAEAAAAAEAARQAGAAARAKHAELTAQESSFRERREALLQGLEGRVKAAKAAAAAAAGALKKEQQRLQVLQLEAAQLQADGSGLAAQITQAAAAVESASTEVDAMGEAVAAKRAQYEAAKAALDALKEALIELDAKAKALRKEGEAAGKKVAAAELELKKMQHRVTRFSKDSEAAGKHVALMLKKHPWIAKEREFFGRAGTDYDFTARDPDGANKRLKALQSEQGALGKKINKKVMGMIEKAESEYQELMHKKAVIETDKGKINSVIAELDQKKNQALQSTWVKVNRDFGSIFSTLLPGTSAKLEPPEGGSVLDGLEVKVAFGSVWKESLTELSGGQRSLLALSLILSLLLFKPAPMYILDEVDAALDLSHTENIGAMLKTHFSHSQFIVVSLKEGMFNNANVIYTTKFVDGISAVHRAAVTANSGSGGSRKALTQKAAPAAAAGGGSSSAKASANNGKVSRKKSKTAAAGSENMAAEAM